MSALGAIGARAREQEQPRVIVPIHVRCAVCARVVYGLAYEPRVHSRGYQHRPVVHFGCAPQLARSA